MAICIHKDGPRRVGFLKYRWVVAITRHVGGNEHEVMAVRTGTACLPHQCRAELNRAVARAERQYSTSYA